jgi:histone-lysine N-methyltransferase SETD1
VYGKRVYHEKSTIQGWGLFALEPISAESLVCEYVGDLVRSRVADKREVMYRARGLPHMYLFRIGESDLIVDATMRGGSARFLNHSCHPNCRSRVVQFGNNQIISFSAVRNIKAHEELTFNYKMEFETDREKGEPCFCGAKQCLGWLNYRETKEKRDLLENEIDSFDSE